MEILRLIVMVEEGGGNSAGEGAGKTEIWWTERRMGGRRCKEGNEEEKEN